MTLSYFNAEVVRTVAALEVENARLRGELRQALEQAAQATDEANRAAQEAARLSKEAEQAKSDKELFAQRYQLLVQQLFGKKSERRVLDQSENQTLPLFPLGELPSPPPSSKKETITYTRTKLSAAPRDRQSKFPESLRRVAVDVPPEEPCCTCCGKEMKHLLKTVVTEKLCCSRDPFFVKQYRRPVYACRECDTAASAPAVPEEVFERTAVEESVVAYLAVNKFRYSLPLYRQRIQLRDLGLSFSEDALVDWTLKGAALLMPVYDELSLSVEGSSYLLADDTPFKVGVRSPSGIQYQRGCLWSLLGDQREVIYRFAPSRTHDSCRMALGNFRGSLIVDGYDGFERFSVLEGVTLAHCNAHARRYFVRAEGSDRKLAHEALSFYRALYDIEADCKERGLSAFEITVERQVRAEPVLSSFRVWLERVSLVTPAKSPLGKACSYVLKRWESLTHYTTDGRIPIDTNELERLIRVIAVGKKNFLHAASEVGAQAAAAMYSLVNSCLLVGVDPFLYLADVMWRVSEKVPVADLLPRNWKLRFLDQARSKYQSSPFSAST